MLPIGKTVISPGEYKRIELPIARLPSDTVIPLTVHAYRAIQPGPTILITGGIHGDEVNGVEIVRRAIERKYFKGLRRGTVLAIPVVNIYGFINFSRDMPDGKDVNRSFPGSAKGSLASRVAHTLTQDILPHVQIGIDFHTGGGNRYNYPQLRFTEGDTKAKELAQIFAAPYLIKKKMLDKSFRKTGYGSDIPILTYEGGEALRVDGFSLEHGLNGMLRILHYLDMIASAPQPFYRPILFNNSSWVRAERSGLFIWSQESGARVCKGEILGTIYDIHGDQRIKVYAHHDGYIIGHNNAPVVNQGDALFNLGYQFEKLEDTYT